MLICCKDNVHLFPLCGHVQLFFYFVWVFSFNGYFPWVHGKLLWKEGRKGAKPVHDENRHRVKLRLRA